MTRNTQSQDTLHSNLIWMILIKEKSNNKDEITKTRDFLQEIIEELGSSKDINRNGKRSYEKAVQQEKTIPTRTKVREQHIVGSQKIPNQNEL